jgi:hypothetical protein
MATLTNPVNKQNIVDRFADYVVATANSGIGWGTNAVPQYYDTNIGTVNVVNPAIFGGTTSGKGIGINGTSISGTTITASSIYNTLLAETNAYTMIRNLRATLTITASVDLRADQPNSGTIKPNGLVYDATVVAYMNSGYLQSVGSPNNGGVAATNTISAPNLETLFFNMRAAYNSARGTTFTENTVLCHASCHSSCHSSRGRR